METQPEAAEVKRRLAFHMIRLRYEHPEWDPVELDLEANASLLAVELLLSERRNAARPAVPAVPARPVVKPRRRWLALLGRCLWIPAAPEKGSYHGCSPLATALWLGATVYAMVAAGPGGIAAPAAPVAAAAAVRSYPSGSAADDAGEPYGSAGDDAGDEALE